jgi:hypothetical protein
LYSAFHSTLINAIFGYRGVIAYPITCLVFTQLGVHTWLGCTISRGFVRKSLNDPLLNILIDPSSAAPRLMMYKDAVIRHPAACMQIQAPADLLQAPAIQPYDDILQIDAFDLCQSPPRPRKRTNHSKTASNL